MTTEMYRNDQWWCASCGAYVEAVLHTTRQPVHNAIQYGTVLKCDVCNNEVTDRKKYTIPRRLCIFCKNMDMQTANPAYSEVTPGTDFYALCWKNHWELDGFECSTFEYRNAIFKAATCDDWELDDTFEEDV